jgi:RHH-type proline utilization regulon transcriptional repressor/proline dehydrogenase/delta 1-pyrroline-5-carboxylate dehydrogenase
MALSTTHIPSLAAKDEIAKAVVEQVQQWVLSSSQLRSSASAKRLSGLLQDPNGLAFAVGFVDGVIRPEDKNVAAKNLYALRKLTPKFLPLPLRMLLSLGANLAPLFAWLVIPIARRVLRSFVSHLVIDASTGKLARTLARLSKNGTRLNINLLGEAVLGREEADRRLEKVKQILSRDDVDYVSVKVSATINPHSPYAFDETVDHVVARLSPLYDIAVSGGGKFINLDMEEYHDLDLTVSVFKKVLEQPKFKELTAGIVLQAYLPDALRVMIDLQQWAQLRVLAGGAPIKVRVVKGANLPMEQVDAELHGWPLATVSSKAEADANYKRVLNYALTPDRVRFVKIGVAGHNLFDIAFANIVAKGRGAQEGMDVEMLLGMAQAQSEVVKKTVGTLVLYTPVVHPQEFDVAIAYLIRRLEEGASKENFLSNAFELTNPTFFELEKDRFLHSVELLDQSVPIPTRLQNRSSAIGFSPAAGFANAPDTDPSLSQNRSWAREIIARSATSSLAVDLVAAQTLSSEAELNSVITRISLGGERWGKLSVYTRADYLHSIGATLEQNRDRLIEVAMSETGKTFEQADVEVSEAVDFAHYYAQRCKELTQIDGAKPKPLGLTVVTPPWNFPIAIPVGSVLAALAAGSGVILKPAGEAARCGALLGALISEVIEVDVFSTIQISESGLGKQLLAHADVDQVILTGGYETAELFKSFKPDMRLLAETSGKNAIIVTPNADYDLAAKDIAYSAFGHAGQKCSAASIVILVGSVAKSKRFRRQLIDAVQSLKVAHSTDPEAQLGPLVAAPQGKLLAGLTRLERGEKWVLEPKQLDQTGKLWSPGIKENVAPRSQSHLVEYFGPILSIMTTSNLEQAIALQNAVDYGLTAGIHSLDATEVKDWLSRVRAGNLYVNRGITGAIVERQPFGGWKRSSVGPSTKAGGPNYLISLSNWERTAAAQHDLPLSDHQNAVLALAAASAMSDSEVESLLRGAQSDLWHLQHFFGSSDEAGLSAERNVLRYFRSDCTLRVDLSASNYDSWRSLLVLIALGKGEVSAFELPPRLHKVAQKAGLKVIVEDAQSFSRSLSLRPRRVRFVGQEQSVEAGTILASCDIALYRNQTTESGRIELLPYFKEQAVSVTAHRFGNPLKFVSELAL